MKTQFDVLMSKLPKKFFLVMAVLVTLCIVIDSAFHASHVMVFFSLIILSVLFLSMYAESEHHKLAVSIICLVLGSIYLAFYPVDFTWWRFSFYSVPLYLSGILFMVSWVVTRHAHQKHSGIH
jgi:phosphotransferase system  glucose/maltose/N-acetylglucosamine-specific IIC component